MTIESPSAEMRRAFRNGLVKPTTGLANGYAQANLVIMPSRHALDFLIFCQKNPKPCPILEVGSRGNPLTKVVADGADVRVDIPAYYVYRNGVLVDKVTDINAIWDDDLVYFLTGCSFGFEGTLISHGIPVRHIDSGTNCPMYVSNMDCAESGPFRGKMVVSMRGIPGGLVPRAVTVTAKYPASHGSPVYIGDPAGLGIGDLNNPDFGGKPVMEAGDVPVFWACGVTTQRIACEAKLPLVIGHAPGHMFITDILNEDMSADAL